MSDLVRNPEDRFSHNEAHFNQVDGAIQETKNLMNAIAKVVTTCFVCATKVRLVP